uniref:ZP domain-containing protein n=1 Tax=Angiostrongylus cantonensis TaxID=6313 RepID=A0A0K0D4K9_ANGCA
LKYQTFLTSCNAVSSSGQVLHLVDENGCIVDSELIGEIVYNSFIPKVFARARMFKLMNSEKYRIKCNIQMCSTDSVCKNRTFPPKCAFTKDEILKRYAPKTKTESIEGSIIAGTINNVYERQVKVASEWITVHSSEYTNIEQLNERFFLSTTMDENKEEDIQPSPKHFLMEISYRRNTLTSTASTVKYSATTDASRVTEGIVNTETGKEHSEIQRIHKSAATLEFYTPYITTPYVF